MGINLIITIDVDNDGIEDDERNNLSWNSLERIPEIKGFLSDMNLKITWFIRADNQLRDVYGTVAYILEQYHQQWKQMENSGDEIAWHPHIYEWSQERNQYIPDMDEIRRSDKLIRVREELVKLGYNHSSARLGEAYHTNTSMKTLEYLSIKVDATAIPGRLKKDASRWFDWSITPNEPYYPSKSDYRIPNKESHWDILEVPMTTAPIKASYDETPRSRYINPVYQHSIFKPVIKWIVESHTKPDREYFLTLTFHPNEVIPRDEVHPLYAFSIDELKHNIKFLLNELVRINIPFKSTTVSEAREIFVTTGYSN
jgi:hypothetical protein